MNKIFNFLKNYKIFNFLKNSDDELVVIPSLDQTSILHIFGSSSLQISPRKYGKNTSRNQSSLTVFLKVTSKNGFDMIALG